MVNIFIGNILCSASGLGSVWIWRSDALIVCGGCCELPNVMVVVMQTLNKAQCLRPKLLIT